MKEKSPIVLYEKSRPVSRFRRVLYVVLFLGAIFQFYTTLRKEFFDDNVYQGNAAAATAPKIFIDSHTSTHDMDASHLQSFLRLLDALEKNQPKIPAALEVTSKLHNIPSNAPPLRRDIDAVHINSTLIGTLGDAHSNFEDTIQISQLGKSLIYRPDQRGIVTTSSANGLLSVLVQLRMLRRTESNLPVDVFLLNEEDYNDEICEKLFHKLNARCRIISTLMGKRGLPSVEINGKSNQRVIKANEPLHKLLALLFSDYEENLLLDQNTLIYNKPDQMFREEPFLSKGLIMWPDFWTSSVSPRLDLIQRQTSYNRPARDRTSTVDMSQLVLSKSLQGDSLLLAIYYTCFGRGLYDVLLRQISGGEEVGSQAIKAAARHFDNRFYMVKKQVEAVGHYKFASNDDLRNGRGKAKGTVVGKKQFRAVATLQHFPVDDYQRRPANQQRPLFIHAARNATFDPLTIMQPSIVPVSKMIPIRPVMTGGRSRIAASRQRFSFTSTRMWQEFSARHASNGWDDPDPEHALFEEIANVACIDLEKVSSYREESHKACKVLQKHVDRFE